MARGGRTVLLMRPDLSEECLSCKRPLDYESLRHGEYEGAYCCDTLWMRKPQMALPREIIKEAPWAA